MKNNNILKVTGAGDSHGHCYTGIIEGLPSGLEITLDEIQLELNRRKPGQDFASSRKEADLIEITSGYYQGKTTGAPLAFYVKNTNHESKDYDLLKTYLRPGHVDSVREIKYPHFDYRGSGPFSARFTLVYVVAGAFAKKILQTQNIKITAYVSQIASIKDEHQYANLCTSSIEQSPLRMANPEISLKAEKFLKDVIEKKMSVGSEVTVQITGLPVGLGSAHTHKINAELAYSVFSLPAVQAVSFGNTNKALTQFGHEFHDQIISLSNNNIKFASNNHGGILGGMTTSNPIVIQVILKPPSSFSHAQNYWNKIKKCNEVLELPGRFDPVLGPRFVPVVEGKLAIDIVNFIHNN